MKFWIVAGSDFGGICGHLVELSAECSEAVSDILKFQDEFHPGSTVACLDLNRDSLISSGTDEVVRVYDLATGKSCWGLTKHQGTVRSVACAGGEGRRPEIMLTGGDDGRICLWNLKKGEVIWDFTDIEAKRQTSTTSKASKTPAKSPEPSKKTKKTLMKKMKEDKKIISLVDEKEERLEKKRKEATEESESIKVLTPILSLSFVGDVNIFISLHSDGEIRVWDTWARKPEVRRHLCPKIIGAKSSVVPQKPVLLCLNSDGSFYCILYANKLQIFSTSSDAVTTIPIQDGLYSCVCWEGSILAAGTSTGKLFLFRIEELSVGSSKSVNYFDILTIGVSDVRLKSISTLSPMESVCLISVGDRNGVVSIFRGSFSQSTENSSSKKKSSSSSSDCLHLIHRIDFGFGLSCLATGISLDNNIDSGKEVLTEDESAVDENED